MVLVRQHLPDTQPRRPGQPDPLDAQGFRGGHVPRLLPRASVRIKAEGGYALTGAASTGTALTVRSIVVWPSTRVPT